MDETRGEWLRERGLHLFDDDYCQFACRDQIQPFLRRAVGMLDSDAADLRYAMEDSGMEFDDLGDEQVSMAWTVLMDLDDIVRFELPERYSKHLPEVTVNVDEDDFILLEWQLGPNRVCWYIGGTWEDSSVLMTDGSDFDDAPKVESMDLSGMTLDDYVWPLSSFVSRSVKALESTAA